ncbi:unnamed protein product [marine sediment metagenome]|uniref:Uncharacterized protein n=1 Tax=marine sediment metagenome TaxID=412755 RepID=X1QAC3_9ZZZZ
MEILLKSGLDILDILGFDIVFILYIIKKENNFKLRGLAMSNQKKRIYLMVSMGRELREKIQKLAESKGLTAAG